MLRASILLERQENSVAGRSAEHGQRPSSGAMGPVIPRPTARDRSGIVIAFQFPLAMNRHAFQCQPEPNIASVQTDHLIPCDYRCFVKHKRVRGSHSEVTVSRSKSGVDRVVWKI